ncbi:hypothetical protein BKA62DRAFT_833442 [Auriculariales sp. MPI-PUGE-AT-0066]|nr:hypothetical protein BKA62DRAFT_833442 [Auriculariales sp. MPI-PUGE-AT-0066]
MAAFYRLIAIAAFTIAGIAAPVEDLAVPVGDPMFSRAFTLAVLALAAFAAPMAALGDPPEQCTPETTDGTGGDLSAMDCI